ncbi:ABC transporter ATP-binding protein [Fibrella sp. WM1]|uniref:ABC transporter ATP-binding protein n=1 Tax=Fibrella musci TaxID=3242485 RepID=UPI003521DC75
MPILHATNLRRAYGPLPVLNDVSLTIDAGEVVSIVGASGAGKSTLLHILGTLDRPDGGSVTLAGQDVFSLNDKQLARFRNEQIGFVFQFHNLLPEFTALENVAIPGFIAGRNENEVRQRAAELLSRLGLTDRQQHFPAQLSGGEQQRVAVARALINQPAVVFADEPSGNLDSRNAEELHQLFFDLRDAFGQTFIIVTHNETLATLADRSVTLRDGRVVKAE